MILHRPDRSLFTNGSSSWTRISEWMSLWDGIVLARRPMQTEKSPGLRAWCPPPLPLDRHEHLRPCQSPQHVRELRVVSRGHNRTRVLKRHSNFVRACLTPGVCCRGIRRRGHRCARFRLASSANTQVNRSRWPGGPRSNLRCHEQRRFCLVSLHGCGLRRRSPDSNRPCLLSHVARSAAGRPG